MDIEIKNGEPRQVRDFFLDRVVLRVVKLLGIFLLPGWCNICRKPTIFLIRHLNLREDVICIWCKSFNRKRQMMHVFEKNYSEKSNAKIWNTESRRSFHETLNKVYRNNYIASEYIDPDIVSGTSVNGIRHEDMCDSSFESNSLDIIFSSDDLEHVPEPWEALKEISRVLKTGGRFIFTAPFNIDADRNDVRAKMKPDGNIIHLKKPLYHEDPLNPAEGILVYNIFGWELVRMCAASGLDCRVQKLYMPLKGILGTNAFVFDCKKKGT